jgi:hypothetical protein
MPHGEIQPLSEDERVSFLSGLNTKLVHQSVTERDFYLLGLTIISLDSFKITREQSDNYLARTYRSKNGVHMYQVMYLEQSPKIVQGTVFSKYQLSEKPEDPQEPRRFNIQSGFMVAERKDIKTPKLKYKAVDMRGNWRTRLPLAQRLAVMRDFSWAFDWMLSLKIDQSDLAQDNPDSKIIPFPLRTLQV